MWINSSSLASRLLTIESGKNLIKNFFLCDEKNKNIVFSKNRIFCINYRKKFQRNMCFQRMDEFDRKVKLKNAP